MANQIGLNYESFIVDLRKQRDALMQAVHQIDQAISSLEAIPRLVGNATESESTISPVAAKPSHAAAKPTHKANNSPASVREETLKIVEELTGDISQPVILQAMLERFPGSEQMAKEKQWSARIAGELRKLEEAGTLRKVKKSFANNPNIFRKVEGLGGSEPEGDD